MKRILIIILLFTGIAKAQYSHEKISVMLTGNSERTWNARGINYESSVQTYTFNRNGQVQMQTAQSGKTDKWTLVTADNIRWFLTIGKQKNEIIISFDKKGKQYIKLTQQPEGKATVYYETVLNSVD